MSRKSLFGLAAMIALSGCGSAYISSTVTRSDANVRVVDLSPEIVLIANSAAYAPRSLPSAFSNIAGPGGQPRGAGALPDQVYLPEDRPAALEVRLPPDPEPGPYRIGTGDVLLLATPQGETTAEELAGVIAAQNRRQGYTVQDDGTIAIPDVGRIMVGGRTLQDAEDAVFEALIAARIDPSFSVEVAEFNSQRVSVGGAVGEPGIVPVTLTPLFLDQVIASAGGVETGDEYAVVRIYRDGILYQVPVSELFSDRGLQRTRLIDGDSIFVDTEFNLDRAQGYFEEQIQRADFTRRARADALDELQIEIALQRNALADIRDNFRSSLDLGAVAQDHVYVVGEVSQPGRFPLPFGNTASLADALLENGGVAPQTGNPSHIYVLRGSPDPHEFGAITAYRLNARNAANFVLATRLELRPNDVIFVAEQPVTRWSRVVNQITPAIVNLGIGAAGV